MEELSGVVISFDLSMDMLDIYFEGGRDNRTKAYHLIRKFLISKGYETLKDSDYKNNEDTIGIAIFKLKELCNLEKWFPLCAKKVIITPDSIYCDYIDVIKDEIDLDFKQECEEKNKT